MWYFKVSSIDRLRHSIPSRTHRVIIRARLQSSLKKSQRVAPRGIFTCKAVENSMTFFFVDFSLIIASSVMSFHMLRSSPSHFSRAHMYTELACSTFQHIILFFCAEIVGFYYFPSSSRSLTHPTSHGIENIFLSFLLWNFYYLLWIGICFFTSSSSLLSAEDFIFFIILFFPFFSAFNSIRELYQWNLGH